MEYRVATRSSSLALCQTNIAIEKMRQVLPDTNFNILPMKTILDDTQIPISSMGGKISFVKELDDAVLSGLADIAVHSLKDMPAEVTAGLSLAAVLERVESRDVLVSCDFPSLSSLPYGALIGTSSLRRSAQISFKRSDLQVLPCRGNIDTRIKKLQDGDFTALVLAGAGLERLGKAHLISEYLDSSWMLPASGQGAIAVMCRAEDDELKKNLQDIHHSQTGQLTFLERKVVRILGGHCQVPLAVHARFVGKDIIIEVMLGYANGDNLLRRSCKLTGESLEQDSVILQDLCDKLLQDGGDEILHYYTAK